MATESGDPAYRDTALTRSQSLIWTGQRLQPGEPLYNMVFAFRIRGAIEIDLFRAAFQALVDRSDALRTTFVDDHGTPRQRFHDRLLYRVELVDLASEAQPEAALDRWQHEHATRSFDTSRLLFESTLLRVAQDDHVWFFNQHHLITDAWSTALLYRHTQAFYALAREGRLDDAVDLPSYRDVVEYENAGRDSRAAQRAASYWQSRLSTPLLPSLFYRPTPGDRTGCTQRVEFPMGRVRSHKVRTLAASDTYRAISEDLACFQIFATALFAWLYRISANRTLAIGTPSHGRSTALHKQTPGLFIEIFPLQTAIEDDESFASLYDKVARTMRDLLINSPPGSSGFEHNRAYDVVLNYITANFGDFDGRPVATDWVHADHGDRSHLVRMQVERFDLADQFRLFFDLNVDTFVGDERQRAGQHYLCVLDALLADPDQRIDDVDLVDASERARLLDYAGAESKPQDDVPTVVALIEQKAAATPEATAVTCAERSLSYAQLMSNADALAERLAACGAARGVCIAIALPRSIEAVTAILAVLKTGAAYVPLDTDYPIERIAFMLADCAAPLIVTLAALRAKLPGDVQTLCLDRPLPDEVARTEEASAGDDAYVIYTSGSTGRPKGVVIRHANLSNYLCWARDYYLDGQALTWALFSSLSFDLTVTSIFVPLISGGRIVVYPESTERREIAIRRVVEDNVVDIIKLTPAHLALIQPMDLSSSRLRKLIVGGEDLKTSLARSISKYFGDQIDIYNEYGPTEGTVACSVQRFDPLCDTATSVPIGSAIRNAQIYVLDNRLRMLPRGVAGELCIGGAGVARGYLQRDDLTGERFIPDPFRAGETMYRSGDLARFDASGTLCYLGRTDDQVKINGVRIEPGEIEAAMLTHPAVKQAVVNLVEHGVAQEDETSYCTRCGISASHPKAQLHRDGVCHICRVYEQEHEQAMAYFGSMDDLRNIVAKIKASSRGAEDCIMLLSGGKDSTYALCQLVDLGLTPLVFTLDNGYISDGAKANMRRVVAQLGLELVVGETAAMNAIFADSLRRFSNVCNGCFKTIYTLSVNLARERGIRYICTGLSRGQIFETRVADLFNQRIFDPVKIDATIIEARKAYHRTDDAVSDALDVSVFREDAVFEEIRYLDFYRYADVSLDEMLAYLGSRVPWVRPADTGRSTNCLINEAGIFVHKKERGYHNYALPYSWDVRLGHKQRDAARAELDDDISIDNVQRILGEIGYQVSEAGETRRRFLTGYYVADAPLDAVEIQTLLTRRLPPEFIPGHFIHMTALPLTANGKIDRASLPDPDSARPQLAQAYVAPQGSVETTLAEIWADVLSIDRVGVNDNFFDLGGDSILNIQIVTRARRFGLALTPQQIFDQPTVAALAKVAGDTDQVISEQGAITGSVGLTPVQRRFFAMDLPAPEHYNQAVTVQLHNRPDALVIEESLRQLALHHDALRSRFQSDDDGWHQSIGTGDDINLAIERFDLGALPAAARDAAIDTHAALLHAQIDLENGCLLRAALFDCGLQQPPILLLVIHHLVVDGVSWWVLLEDLEYACSQLASGSPVRLPAKTSSVKRWSAAIENYANSRTTTDSLAYWQAANPCATPIPRDMPDGNNDLSSAETISVRLNRDETNALLVDVAAAWRTQAPDVILAALVQSLTAWTGGDALQIDLEGHGREEISGGIDLLRTVGWFTSLYPTTFSTPSDTADAGEIVRRTRDTLRGVPSRGIGYGALRYLHKELAVRDAMAALPQPDVLFNYLGQWDRAQHDDASFQLVRPVTASFGDQGGRSHLLEINAVVFDARLRIDWTFSEDCHRRATVTGLADAFCTGLRALIAHCRVRTDDQLSARDFPSADLSQGELDNLLDEFGESD